MRGPVHGAGLLVALLAGCATATPQPQAIGDGAFSLTVRADRLTLRSENLKLEAELQALAFCRDRGKALTTYDTRVVEAEPPDYASATLQFRCVAP